MADIKTILLLRFSAMGDVAMTAAALHEFIPALTAPDTQPVHFTMVSRPLFAPFFEGLDNVDFIAADFKKKYKGLAGLWRLFHELRRLKPDVVVDWHNVLRTKILCLLFRLWGFKVKKLNKGRREKHHLTRRRHKQLKPLKPMIERYVETLGAGVQQVTSYKLQVTSRMVRQPNVIARRPKADEANPSLTGNLNLEETSALHGENHQATRHSSLLKLGIAPFAAYKGKTYPLERMEKIAAHFAQLKNVEVYLFGGGAAEVNLLADWASKYKGLTSLAGKMSLSEELALLATMDVVVCMDSANMHLASLVGVPVIAIWGATHPFAGFTGWKQKQSNNIQVDLACRPCSVYGNKACYRNDYACMDIPEQLIIEEIKTLLGVE